MILDLPDLQKLSGYKRPADVKAWLRKNGIAFMVQPSGRPVTTLDAINLALTPEHKRSEPNWAPLKKYAKRNSNF